MVRITILWALGLSALGCSAETVSVPQGCEVTVLKSVDLSAYEWRLKLLVLVDSRRELRPDFAAHVASLEEAVRSGDVDGDGDADFDPPFAPEVVVVETMFEDDLADLVARHVPEGPAGWRTELALVFLTTGDLPEEYASQVWSVLGLHSARLMVFLAVAGVPADLLAADRWQYEEVLSDPRMAPGAGPVCAVDGVEASAAIATTRLMQSFYDRNLDTLLISLCSADWPQQLLAAFAVGRERSAGGTCLPRALPRLDDGRVPCTVVETLPAGDRRSCAPLPGRRPNADDPDRSCTLEQVVHPHVGRGWYYDDFTERAVSRCGREGQLLAYTADAMLLEGATYEVVCVTEGDDCRP